MQARLFLRLFLIAFLVVIPSISQAVLQDEIQVYDDEINAKGEQSLELH